MNEPPVPKQEAGQTFSHVPNWAYKSFNPPDPAKLDMVNHPPHYTVHPSGVECITIVEHMGFNIGNAMKYLWRADEKGNALEDLQKAAWYVQREIERRQKAPKTGR
jgi:uncharacterized protein DUF3310